MKNKKPKLLSRKNIYKNAWIHLREDKVELKNGEKKTFGVVDYSDGSLVVAIDNGFNIYMVKEYKHGAEDYILELPAGSLKNNKEIPLSCAKRELKEETGITAKKWYSLGYLRPITVVMKHKAHIFLAMDLKQEKSRPDNNEFLEIVKISFKKAYKMVLESKIIHGGTVVGILKAHEFLKDKKKINF